MIILIFACICACVYASSCPAYKCANSDICMLYENDEIAVSECGDYEYCPFIESSGESYCVKTQAWPGEPCEDSPCAYGYCNGTYCVGKSSGESCDVSDDCEPKLYCSGNKCEKLISIDSGTCRSDYDCKNSAGCSYGKCIEYMSLQEGSKVECVNNKSDICFSGSCYEDYCLGGLKNDKGDLVECDDSSDCVSSNYYMPIYPVYFYSDCECGTDGKKYCSLFSGDFYMAIYRGYLHDWVRSSDIHHCNTKRRFASDCVRMGWSHSHYMKFNYYQTLALNHTRVESSEKCVSQVFFSDYEEYKSYGNYLYVLLVFIAFI